MTQKEQENKIGDPEELKNKDPERIKLDQAIKSLFSVTNRLLVMILNSLFQENFDLKETKVLLESNEFVVEDYHII